MYNILGHLKGDRYSTDGNTLMVLKSNTGTEYKSAVSSPYKPGDARAFSVTAQEVFDMGNLVGISNGLEHTISDAPDIDAYWTNYGKSRMKQVVVVEPADKVVEIVKVYDGGPKNGTVEGPDKADVRDNGTVDVTPVDPEYNLQEWVTTPDEPEDVTTWDDVPTGGNHGSDPDVPADDGTRTVYVHYKNDDPGDGGSGANGSAHLTESRIAMGTSLAATTTGGLCLALCVVGRCYSHFV